MHSIYKTHNEVSNRPLVPLSINEQIKYFFSQTITKVLGITFIAAIVVGYYFLSNKPKTQTTFPKITTSTRISSTTSTQPPIKVFVTGAVVSPGVVSIAAGSRIDDAIRAVGGIKDVDISKCNLAAFVNDGETINIPQSCNGTITQQQQATSLDGNASTNSKSPSQGKVNINMASQTEIETLPGIGPSIAKSIINYRSQHGRFESINDIRKVKGIGEKKFADLKELISI